MTDWGLMGVPLRNIDAAMLAPIIADTGLGTTWCVRLAALSAFIAGLTCFRRNQKRSMLSWTVACGI